MALKTVDPRFSVYVGGLPTNVSLGDMEELLYELFLQVKFVVLKNIYHTLAHACCGTSLN